MNNSLVVSFKAQNFRNLTDAIVKLSPGINCFYGLNGEGKTNFIEAIYYVCRGKSFRKKTSYPQLLSNECVKDEIIFNILFQNENYISWRQTSSNLELYLNNSKIKRKQKYGCVFLNPFDSFLFHNDPQFRRGWFDSHLSDIDSEYKSNLSKCEKFIRHRNKLLKLGQSDQNAKQINAIDENLAPLLKFIHEKRHEFLKDLSGHTENIFKKVFNENFEVNLVLESKISDLSVDEIKAKMTKKMAKDFIIGSSSIGPSKDDFIIEINGLNSVEFASLGQQKMTYISLLFAYIELFRYKFKSFPIVLIDDVSGELDEIRLKNLIEYLHQTSTQVLITTANKAFMENLSADKSISVFFVDQGEVKNIS